MARANKDVTDPRVQGPRLDPLDRLIMIAAAVADREGLLLGEAASEAPRAGKGSAG